VVPKFLIAADGSIGPRNAVACGSIEEKMGIHGNATCVMNYDGAAGWLVGEEHRGINAMFTMMNEARLGVGVQGLALSEVAYQNAAAYAKDRLQGRALSGAKFPAQAADPIIVHPDVRRMLLTQKSFTEAARALALWVGMLIDEAHSLGRRIALLHGVDSEGDEARCFKPGPFCHQGAERSNEQSRSCEKNQREGNLHGHDRSSKTQAA
jgi:hypothetical protein